MVTPATRILNFTKRFSAPVTDSYNCVLKSYFGPKWGIVLPSSGIPDMFFSMVLYVFSFKSKKIMKNTILPKSPT
ncbi:uncharacterized protein BYT42DRAFT_560630 [Radiomyces spectabilis]|uniref:uncharacterized protein n=1 Tax=Radiomyces spectabilis TaxID=64574 RepID=UPI00222066F7|nr:uncharacterized protein BYT42DRAFT_560630 [Radiomyces spectabilis]KAI8388595.1 hypothetical protein BYT42DRAFT_560630 [Radiomyces spectabilis]